MSKKYTFCKGLSRQIMGDFSLTAKMGKSEMEFGILFLVPDLV
jgi:hypothetical protein